MIAPGVLVVLWAAAVYRVVLSARQPVTIWRNAFTVSVVMAAFSMTLYAKRESLDRLVGVPNLTNLLYHTTTLTGLVSALILIESFHHPVLPRGRVLLHVGIGAATATTMLVAWVSAPVHDRFLPDLAPLATLPSIAVYTAVFYLFMVWALGRVATFCLARGFRRADPAGTVSLVLIGLGSSLGAITSAIWAVAVGARFTADLDPTRLSRAGDILLPFALITWALGVVALIAVSWLLDVVGSYRRLRVLRPVWQVLTDLHPEVRLEPDRVWGLRSWLQTRERRTTIEIEDALRLQRLQQDSGGRVDQLQGVLDLAPVVLATNRAEDL